VELSVSSLFFSVLPRGPAFCLAYFFPAILAFLGPLCRSSERVSLNPSEFVVALSSLSTLSPLFPRLPVDYRFQRVVKSWQL
jgi:hypothetical protein